MRCLATEQRLSARTCVPNLHITASSAARPPTCACEPEQIAARLLCCQSPTCARRAEAVSDGPWHRARCPGCCRTAQQTTRVADSCQHSRVDARGSACGRARSSHRCGSGTCSTPSPRHASHSYTVHAADKAAAVATHVHRTASKARNGATRSAAGSFRNAALLTASTKGTEASIISGSVDFEPDGSKCCSPARCLRATFPAFECPTTS